MTQVALVTHLGHSKSSSANSTLKVMVIRHILEATWSFSMANTTTVVWISILAFAFVIWRGFRAGHFDKTASVEVEGVISKSFWAHRWNRRAELFSEIIRYNNQNAGFVAVREVFCKNDGVFSLFFHHNCHHPTCNITPLRHDLNTILQQGILLLHSSFFSPDGITSWNTVKFLYNV